MKTLTAIIVSLAIILCSFTLYSQNKNKSFVAQYQPIEDMLGPDATLSKWFKQCMKTVSGCDGFEAFLKRLSDSEVLQQRSKRAGLSHNQLYSPIVTLMGKNWKDTEKNSVTERSTIRLSLLELDIALSAVTATLPESAHEEFAREVLRGAKPLTEVAKLPMSAVEAMTFTADGRKLSDRINKTYDVKKAPKDNTQFPNPLRPSPYYLW